jgi:hypothetical protein
MSQFHVLLVRQILDNMVDKINIFLALLFRQKLILNLIESLKNLVKLNMMNLFQKLGSSLNIFAEFLSFHYNFYVAERVRDILKVSDEM